MIPGLTGSNGILDRQTVLQQGTFEIADQVIAPPNVPFRFCGQAKPSLGTIKFQRLGIPIDRFVVPLHACCNEAQAAERRCLQEKIVVRPRELKTITVKGLGVFEIPTQGSKSAETE